MMLNKSTLVLVVFSLLSIQALGQQQFVGSGLVSREEFLGIISKDEGENEDFFGSTFQVDTVVTVPPIYGPQEPSSPPSFEPASELQDDFQLDSPDIFDSN